jgi:hypothetical protein
MLMFEWFVSLGQILEGHAIFFETFRPLERSITGMSRATQTRWLNPAFKQVQLLPHPPGLTALGDGRSKWAAPRAGTQGQLPAVRLLTLDNQGVRFTQPGIEG